MDMVSEDVAFGLELDMLLEDTDMEDVDLDFLDMVPVDSGEVTEDVDLEVTVDAVSEVTVSEDADSEVTVSVDVDSEVTVSEVTVSEDADSEVMVSVDVEVTDTGVMVSEVTDMVDWDALLTSLLL
jgi:hypothetical protein